MEIKIITNQEEWDGWIKKTITHTPLTQSCEWGEILKNEGKHVERLGVYDGNDLLGIAAVVYSNLMLGQKYGFCAKGPLLKYQVSSIKYQEIYNCLITYLKQKRCLFFRIEPREYQVSSIKYQAKKTIDVQPRATLFLDLQKTEEELLKGMHQKTRYNIKLAERKGLKTNNIKDVEGFIQLLKKTGSRDGFRLHEDNHYRCILNSEFSKQLSVTYQSQIIAMGVFIGYGDTFTYLYGASDYEFRNTMAPYLIQWEAIKLGKYLGYHYYDFYGVAPFREEIIQKESSSFSASNYTYNEHHKHAGFTRFKLGFGGSVEQNVGTWDIILRPGLYRLYGLIRKIRRLV